MQPGAYVVLASPPCRYCARQDLQLRAEVRGSSILLIVALDRCRATRRLQAQCGEANCACEAGRLHGLLSLQTHLVADGQHRGYTCAAATATAAASLPHPGRRSRLPPDV